MKSLFADFFNAVFLLEAPLLKTVRALTIRPGKFCQEYLAGKRKSFTKPLQYFLLMLTIYLFALSLVRSNISDITLQNLSGDVEQIKAQKIAKQLELIFGNINYLLFLFPLLLAFFYRLFFGKTGTNYAESLIFAFYVQAHAMLLSVMVLLLALINIRFLVGRQLIEYLYVSFAIVQFSDTSFMGGWIKSTLIITICYSILILTVLAGVFLLNLM
jgi:hypothetical protein